MRRLRRGRSAQALSKHSAGLEPLEQRQLLSAAVSLLPPVLGSSSLLSMSSDVLAPTYQRLTGGSSLLPLQSAGPQGYSPQQIANAYGFSQVMFGNVVGDGTGQTIAIIDAYNDPTIRSDLAGFDAAFNLAAPPSFNVLSQTGTTKLPTVDPASGTGDDWEGEEALDVEWAHALAPGASIILVEANNASPGNLFAAAKWARSATGVTVVSMSFGGGEISSELQYDSDFTTPSGHPGVTFVASTGDSAARGGISGLFAKCGGGGRDAADHQRHGGDVSIGIGVERFGRRYIDRGKAAGVSERNRDAVDHVQDCAGYFI